MFVTPSCAGFADFFFFLLVKSLAVYIYIYKPAVFPPFLCLPSDASSSSKRLLPAFWARSCRLKPSGLGGAALSPIRSTRAEPGADGAQPEQTNLLNRHVG